MRRVFKNPIFVFFMIWALVSVSVVAWGIWNNFRHALEQMGGFYGI